MYLEYNITYNSMNLLQIKIDEKLKKAIRKKADLYGVPVSSLIRIVLVKSFLEQDEEENPGFGNVFNAKRDNAGKGINVEDFLSAL